MRRLKGWFPVTFLLLMFIGSCTEPETHSLYDPTAPTASTPTVTSISPAVAAVAGMDSIVITGQNFSAVPEENTIYFNDVRSAVISASPTRLVTIAPAAAVDSSVSVRVTVDGAVAFSNPLSYSLLAGVVSFGDLAPASNVAPAELVSAMTIDPSGGLILAYAYGAADGGILSFDAAGVRTRYAPATSGVISWTGLKFGAGGSLFAAREFRAIYAFAPGGGSVGALWTALTFGVRITDIDFDQDGYMWAGGDNVNIYRLASDKSVTTFPFDANISSLRVHGTHLYFLADTSDGPRVWRASIAGGVLGTPEVYFDFAAQFPGLTAGGITFSSTGTLVIGTEPPYGIVFVGSNGSWTAPFGFYEQFFGTGVKKMAWGATEHLYASTNEGLLIRFTVRGASGAAYNGNTQ